MSLQGPVLNTNEDCLQIFQIHLAKNILHWGYVIIVIAELFMIYSLLRIQKGFR